MTNRSQRRASEREAHKLEQKRLRQEAHDSPESEPPAQRYNPGPTTPEGTAASSRNALKHGSCSTAALIILGSESMDDFTALEKRWFQGYGVDYKIPANPYEAELIRTAARADWFFQRADRNYSEVESQIMNEQPDLLAWTAQHHQTLARFQRYRTTNANLLAKQRKALEDYRKNRQIEATAKAKLESKAEPKPKPKPDEECSWAEHLMGMRRKAIELGYVNPDGTPTGKK